MRWVSTRNSLGNVRVPRSIPSDANSRNGWRNIAISLKTFAGFDRTSGQVLIDASILIQRVPRSSRRVRRAGTPEAEIEQRMDASGIVPAFARAARRGTPCRGVIWKNQKTGTPANSKSALQLKA